MSAVFPLPTGPPTPTVNARRPQSRPASRGPQSRAASPEVEEDAVGIGYEN